MNLARNVTILLMLSTFVMQTIANKVTVDDRLLRDFSNVEAFKVMKITKRIMATGDKPKLDKFLRSIRKFVYKRRLAKCVKLFGSKSICQNKANFYVWAQMLAKTIMSGEYY